MNRSQAVDLLGAEYVARAARYHRPLYRAALLAASLDLLVLGLAAFGALGRVLLEPFGGWPWWAQVVGFTALLECALALVGLPLALWSGFLRERAWGFSTQTLAGYAADRVKALGIGGVLAAAALAGLVGSARALPRLWPLAAGAAAAAMVAALAFLAPLLIEPLFNRFHPLEDAELDAQLRALAARAGLPVRELLVADASRRTRKANAYVSGLGATRRLVLYDTLLERASPGELAIVLAHELGHRRAGHIVKGALLGMAASAAFVAALWALVRWEQLRDAIAAPAGAASPRVVAFALLLASGLELLAAPLGAGLSRRFEREADRFSLELTGDLPSFEATHRVLAGTNLSDPLPPRAIYLAFFTHPTPVERILAARVHAGAASGAR